MVALVRAHDWAANPLGDPADWSPALVTAASFVLESKFPAALVWGPELITIYNDAFRPILGDKPEALGRPFDHIWAEAWDALEPMVKRAFSGEAVYSEDLPLAIERFGRREQANFTFCYSPVRGPDGTVQGIVDTVMETTRTVEFRARSTILNRELGHRLKNMMTMVQAVATQSLRRVVDREAISTFTDRIGALSSAHEVLLKNNWESAPIERVIARTIRPHGGDGFVLAGEDLLLGERAVLSLSLLLHELATNATKYGALSVPEGQVAVSWRCEGEALVVEWRERGGPPAVESTTKGFGSRLIAGGLVNTGDVSTHYGDEGFEATFRAPLREVEA